MFAVKSTYSIKTPSSLYTPFDTYIYIANNEAYFKTSHIGSEFHSSIFNLVPVTPFVNYEGRFVRKVDLLQLLADKPEEFKHREFWSEIFANTDFSKVIAEVRDAQNFLKDFAYIDLPREWDRLNVDFILNDLHTRASDWIETCYKSLQILATNDEQRNAARRVYNEAWKILKAREKDDNKYTALHEVLAKFGLAVDDLINATLDAHKAKFDNQHGELESELRRLLE